MPLFSFFHIGCPGDFPGIPQRAGATKGSEYMPRTKIFRDKYAAEDFAKALNIGLARTGIKGYQAAEKIGVTAATLCNRRNDPDGFRLKEVRLLYRAGILTEQDIMTYLKGGTG